MRSNFIINLAASNETRRQLKLAGCKTATGVNFTSPLGLLRPWISQSPLAPFGQQLLPTAVHTANGGTSCAARKHLMRQAINVNCLNGQKLEHTLARTWPWIRSWWWREREGGIKGQGSSWGTCIVNEISWCANPAWVNYANVLHSTLLVHISSGRWLPVCILYPGQDIRQWQLRNESDLWPGSVNLFSH